jgi:PmbA protein
MSEQKDTLIWLLDHAHTLGASAADAVLFDTTDISTSIRLGKPEGLERAESKAIGLRVFMGQQQAIVSGTDTDKAALQELAQRAVAMAKATPADPDSTLAPESLYSKSMINLDLCDNDEPDTAWLSQQCKEAEEAALDVKGITNSEGADANYSKSSICLAIHNGKSVAFSEDYNTSHFSISVSVLAGEGTGMERDYDYTTARFRADLDDADALGLNAANRTLKRLNPRKVPTCQVPVIFDPRVSRSLLSTLAGAISGNSIARGSSFLKDSLNEQIFSNAVTIIDNPHIQRGLG